MAPNTCCEGKLHSVHCWWVVHNDDGRDQATGDPYIDYPEDYVCNLCHQSKDERLVPDREWGVVHYVCQQGISTVGS